MPLGADAGLLSVAVGFAGVCVGAGVGVASGGVSIGFSVACSSAGCGGNMVASIDSGGATSGVLIGRLGTDQSRAMRVPCMPKLSAVLHHERGRSRSMGLC